MTVHRQLVVPHRLWRAQDSYGLRLCVKYKDNMALRRNMLCGIIVSGNRYLDEAYVIPNRNFIDYCDYYAQVEQVTGTYSTIDDYEMQSVIIGSFCNGYGY